MIRHTISILGVALAAAAMPAAAQDLYYVQNDTGRSLSCGLRWEPRRHMDLFVLVRGTGVVRPARGGGVRRSLICDSQPKHLQHFTVRPGVRYHLVRDDGVVVIRSLGPAE